MYSILAFTADSTPRGAFSTTNASEGFNLSLDNPVINGWGLGLPSSRSSLDMIRSNLERLFCSNSDSTSFLDAPLTTAVKQFLQLSDSINSFTPGKAPALWSSSNNPFFRLLIFSTSPSSGDSRLFRLKISRISKGPGIPSSKNTFLLSISILTISLNAFWKASAWNGIASMMTPSMSNKIPFNFD